MINLVYDGSLCGFLTALDHLRHQPALSLRIRRQAEGMPLSIPDDLRVRSRYELAEPLLEEIVRKAGQQKVKDFCACFLSASVEVEELLTEAALCWLDGKKAGRETGDKIKELAELTRRECRRWIEKTSLDSISGPERAEISSALDLLPMLALYFAGKFPVGNRVLIDRPNERALEINSGRIREIMSTRNNSNTSLRLAQFAEPEDIRLLRHLGRGEKRLAA